MIDMVMNGRLGNQLFMYAMARKIQISYNKKKIYMNTWLLYSNKISISLDNYKLNDNIEFYNKQFRTKKNVFHGDIIQNYFFMKYLKKINNYTFSQVAEYEKVMERKYKNLGMFLVRDRYVNPNNIKNKKCILLYGYFQSCKYFEDIREILLEELVPKKPLMKKNEELYNNISNTESVCVTVRLGDDFTNSSVYNVCTLKYYIEAINYLNNILENPVFYMFSDRIDLLRDKFGNLDINMVFEEEENPDYEKLRIMSNCKHFILSNSSFSWWCQYLSTNENKLVIAPSRWYNGNVPCDIYMDNWYLIEP